MAVSAQGLHTLNADGAVSVDRNNGAHLLQNIDEVHDFRLDSGALQRGNTVISNRSQQSLLGCANGGERQLNNRAVKTGCGALDMDAFRLLINDCTELTQSFQVEVDGTATNRAATQLGNEGFTQLVKKRAAEQDRDARGTGKGVDIRTRGNANLRRIHSQRTAFLIVINLDTVKGKKVRHDIDVTNQRDVVQLGGSICEQRRNHCFGDKVLRPADGNGPLKGVATFNSKFRGHSDALLAVDFCDHFRAARPYLRALNAS